MHTAFVCLQITFTFGNEPAVGPVAWMPFWVTRMYDFHVSIQTIISSERLSTPWHVAFVRMSISRVMCILVEP